jgi:predicted GNAT superfamily acetyltransferase
VIKGPQQINNDMNEVLGESIAPDRVVQNWSRDFKLDRDNLVNMHEHFTPQNCYDTRKH